MVWIGARSQVNDMVRVNHVKHTAIQAHPELAKFEINLTSLHFFLISSEATTSISIVYFFMQLSQTLHERRSHVERMSFMFRICYKSCSLDWHDRRSHFTDVVMFSVITIQVLHSYMCYSVHCHDGCHSVRFVWRFHCLCWWCTSKLVSYPVWHGWFTLKNKICYTILLMI